MQVSGFNSLTSDSIFRTTLHSYYRKWFWSVAERNGLTSECSYSRFHSAWMSFLSLHPVDSSVFQCTICSVSPEIVICDGITLSFQKRFRIGLETKNDEDDQLHGCRLVIIVKEPMRFQFRSITLPRLIHHPFLYTSRKHEFNH